MDAGQTSTYAPEDYQSEATEAPTAAEVTPFPAAEVTPLPLPDTTPPPTPDTSPTPQLPQDTAALAPTPDPMSLSDYNALVEAGTLLEETATTDDLLAAMIEQNSLSFTLIVTLIASVIVLLIAMFSMRWIR